MLVRKRRRRGHEELKENILGSETDDDEMMPSTSSGICVQKISFANIQQLSPRLTRKQEYFPFEFLPDHVQEQIASYLPLRSRVRFERVCVDWRDLMINSWRVVKHAQLPQSITQGLGISPINDAHVCGYLRKCGQYLERIDLFVPHLIVGQHVLHSISHRCANLRELHLRTDIDGASMTHLLKGCSQQLSQLTSLTIVYKKAQTIHNGLRAIARSLVNLRSFRLECGSPPSNVAALFPNSNQMTKFEIVIRQREASSRVRVTGSFILDLFSYLADVYPRLEKLEVQLEAMDMRAEEELECVLRRVMSGRRLSRLSLGIHLPPDEQWGHRALKAIGANTSLRELELQGCELPSDLAAIITHAGMGNTITKLSLRNLTLVSGSALMDLVSALPCLASFHLRYPLSGDPPPSVDTHSLSVMFMVCPRLVELSLQEIPRVDRVSLAASAHAAYHDQLQFASYEGLATPFVLKVVGMPRRKRRISEAVRCCSTHKSTAPSQMTYTVLRECRVRKERENEKSASVV